MKMKSQVAQSCPTLSDSMDCSLPGSSAHGIFQARVLELGAIAFSLNCVAAAAAKSLQSCLTLCDTIDGSPPGCPVPGILQARTLEWVGELGLFLSSLITSPIGPFECLLCDSIQIYSHLISRPTP